MKPTRSESYFERVMRGLGKGRPVTEATIGAAEKMAESKARFERQRAEIERTIKDGARLTRHRISL